MTDTATTANLLADPTRVRILDALIAGPMRTTDLSTATGMTPAALSRHLNLLRRAEVVARTDVAGDGRGRAYELRPAALDALAGWLRATTWAAELAAASTQPRAQELLARMGGFLDAFAASDVGYFERHLRADAVMVFPGTSEPFDKQGCLDSVESHPPYRRHAILGEPLVRLVGAATTVITFTAEVATAADEDARLTFITAVIEETDPWKLVHLQWTPRGA
jgi:DNA-binding transcriptional ArsR family regulator